MFMKNKNIKSIPSIIDKNYKYSERREYHGDIEVISLQEALLRLPELLVVKQNDV